MASMDTITMQRVLGGVPTTSIYKPPRRNAVRVAVLRQGQWVDITNRVRRGTITESNDQAMMTLDLELLNGTGYPSLAPRRTDSEINIVGNEYDPLLWPDRQIIVEAASSTDGSTPTNWVPVFHGVLGDDIDAVASPHTVSIYCRDLAAKWLMDDHIVGPVVYTDMYASQIIQQILIDRHAAGGVPVVIPFSVIGDDDHWIEEYKIENQTAWQAIQNIVNQSGWDVRLKLDESDDTFKLTYWLPSTDMSQVDWVITGSDIRAETLKISDVQRRNRVEVVYRDDKGHERMVVATNNDVPVRLCRIGEGDTSSIRDEESAQRFADRVFNYLKDLHATDELRLPFNPYIGLFHVLEVQSDRVRTDPERYAVDSRTLEFSADNWSLSLVASGSVGVRPQVWIDKETRPGVKRPWDQDEVVGEDGGTLPDDLGRRPVAKVASALTQARLASLPTLGSYTLETGPDLIGDPVDFDELLDGVDIAYVSSVVRRGEPGPVGWKEATNLADDVMVLGVTRDNKYLATLSTEQALYTSSDGGEVWDLLGQTEGYVTAAVDGDEGIVAVGDAGGGFIQQFESGQSTTYWLGDTEWPIGITHGPEGYLVAVVDTDTGDLFVLTFKDPDDGITQINLAPTYATTLTGVGYAGGKYFVLGNHNTIFVSADLLNFQEVHAIQGDPQLYAVAYSNVHDSYVAVGAGGWILHSTDGGATWVQAPIPTPWDLMDVTDGLNGLIVVGLGSTIAQSIDGGATWEMRPAPTQGLKHLYGVASRGLEYLAAGEDGTVLRGLSEGGVVEDEQVVGRVVGHTATTLTLDTPWAEDSLPDNLQTDYYILWSYTAVTASQLAVAEVDEDGFVTIPGTTIVGKLIVRDSLIIQNSDGSMVIDEDGLRQTGADGTTALSPSGLIFANPNGETMGYVRGVKAGIAEDGDYVPLPFVNMPHVLLQPYDIMTYDPVVPERQRIVVQALDVSPEGFSVYAKTVAEAGDDHTEQFAKTTAYHPGQAGYCRGDSDHRSAKSNQWSNQSIFSVNEVRTYTTVNSDVTKITLLLTEMMHVSGFAGHYRARNKLTYQIRVRPVGSPTWTRTHGPITRQISTVGNLFTPYFTGTHREAVAVIDNLPADQYEIEVRITDKVIDSANGYNYNTSCWLLVDGWIESSSTAITPSYPAKVQWLALESNIPGT